MAKDAILITCLLGVFYMNFSCLQASLSTLVIKLYGYSELQAGLLYIPFGLGGLVASNISGLILNYDYRMTAQAHGLTIDKKHGDDLHIFPIQKARFRSVWYFIAAAGICTIGYGWSLHTKTHISVPLILQFFIGLGISSTFNICNTLLTDLHPKAPAASQAANNIVRCSFAAAGLAFLQPMLDAIGVGWTFTFFGVVSSACLGLAWLEWRFGKQWANSMREKGIER
jgi:MFS family permease